MLKRIKLLRTYNGRRAGVVVEVDAARAARMVAAGVGLPSPKRSSGFAQAGAYEQPEKERN